MNEPVTASTAGHFRKKPRVVEAILCSEAMRLGNSDWWAQPKWLIAAYDRGGVVYTTEGIHLPTLEGTMLARPEDWIICGVQGEVYPCKPDIFVETYEAVDDTAPSAPAQVRSASSGSGILNAIRLACTNAIQDTMAKFPGADWKGVVVLKSTGPDQVALVSTEDDVRVNLGENEAMTALQELVRLKRLKDALEQGDCTPDENGKDWHKYFAEYTRCKPLAWETAFALVDGKALEFDTHPGEMKALRAQLDALTKERDQLRQAEQLNHHIDNAITALVAPTDYLVTSKEVLKCLHAMRAIIDAQKPMGKMPITNAGG